MKLVRPEDEEEPKIKWEDKCEDISDESGMKNDMFDYKSYYESKKFVPDSQIAKEKIIQDFFKESSLFIKSSDKGQISYGFR